MVKVFKNVFPALYKNYGNKTPGFYMSERLKKNLDICKNRQKSDNDLFLIIDGPEGSGKSVFAQQVGFYLDPSLTVDRIAFNSKDFKNKISEAKKDQCIIFDEAMKGLHSRSATSALNKMLVELFSEMRQDNLIIIIVLPTFFELDKYPAIHRSFFLLHTYLYKLKRGYFKFYNFQDKKFIYLKGKRTYDYSISKPRFKGRFTKFYTVDEDLYKKRKRNAYKRKFDLENSEEVPKTLENEYAAIKDILKLLLKGSKTKVLEKLSQKVGRGKNFLYKIMRE